MEDLGDFLQQSGVAFEDIREAVNSGIFDKPAVTKSTESSTKDELAANEDVRENEKSVTSDTERCGK